MSQASRAAAEYAAKKQAALQRANALRSEREAQATASARSSSSGFVRGGGSAMRPAFGGGEEKWSGAGMVSFSMRGLDVEAQSVGPHTERIVVRYPPGKDRPLQLLGDGDDGMDAKRWHKGSNTSSSDRESRGTHRFTVGDEDDPSPFSFPPANPSGERHDLSDRPLLCASQSLDPTRVEVIFGGADHALYSVTVGSRAAVAGGGRAPLQKRPITMYSKRSGHTDWVTSVTHLADGRALSAAMDGKLCLWESSRTTCTDLTTGHTKSVAKLLADPTGRLVLSCGYDAAVCLWDFGRAGVRNGPRASSLPAPVAVFGGHREAVVECVFLDEDRCASGDRTGGLCVWDVAGASSNPVFRAQAHRGSITAMVASAAGSLLLTSGVDGMVRGWDLRSDASLPCFEAPAHAGLAVQKRDVAGAKGGKPPSGAVAAAAVACMVALPTRGGGACSSVVTGGADSAVCLVDVRFVGGGGTRVVQRWAHHRVGLYSLCAAGGGAGGDRCFFSGDGAGMLLCYDSGVDGDAAVKYGVGASEQGAIRAILRVGENKVVTGSEDGKALVFSF